MKSKDLLFKRLLLAIIFNIIVSKTSFAQAPIITSFTPSFGNIGTLVTITGNNLNNLDTIKIGGVSAIKISTSNSKLVAMVMPGAVTGKIYFTNSGGNTISINNFIKTNSVPPSMQQGNKLVGTDNSWAKQGTTVRISADGNTAIVGGYLDTNGKGAAWIYTRTAGVWSQEGSKLVGTGYIGTTFQGASVAISADGNTAMVGGYYDNNEIGAVWVFTRSNGVWTQQGNKLVGTGNIGASYQGYSVSISADGNTAIVGGVKDSSYMGAFWFYSRLGGVWTQQGNKYVGTDNNRSSRQGYSVSMSADGNTSIIGGDGDSLGSFWVYTRIGGIWSQQGNKLKATGVSGSFVNQGISVCTSADGNSMILGLRADNNKKGAVWFFTRNNGVWSQQGNKLIGLGNIGASGIGSSVSMSADGNTAIAGGDGDDNKQGAVWAFKRNENIWTQYNDKFIGKGNIGKASQGISVSLSADASTAIIGGNNDNSANGAAWVFTGAPTISISSSITPFAACSATNSNTQSFTVEGANISSGNLLITVPIGFEISISMGSGYASSINLIPVSGTVVITNIYIRLSSSVTSTFSGNIVCSATNAISQNISVSGTIFPKPIIGTITGNTTPNSLSSPFNYSVSSQPNSTYFWLVTNGNIQNGQGTNSVNIIWPSVGSASLKANITNSNGCTDSSSLAINITNVGINNLSLENDLKVFPNPTESVITISNKNNLVGKNYIIQNLVGQTLLSGKLNLDETIVNIETLQSGMYFLSIDGMNKQSIKIMKE